MKKNDKVLERVRRIEEKYGIRYAKTDGKLYTTLKVFSIILMIYTFGVNCLFLLGMGMQYLGTEHAKEVANPMITVGCCTAVLIVGLVLLCTKLKKAGAVLGLVPLPLSVLTFANLMKDDLGLWGFKPSFYWRHFGPCAVLFLLLVWMLIIDIRATVKINRQYSRVLDNIYRQYQASADNGDALTDEQWDDFLTVYDPRVQVWKQAAPEQEEDDTLQNDGNGEKNDEADYLS